MTPQLTQILFTSFNLQENVYQHNMFKYSINNLLTYLLHGAESFLRS